LGLDARPHLGARQLNRGMTNRTSLAHRFDSHLARKQPAEQPSEATGETRCNELAYAACRPQIRVTDPLVELISLVSRPWRWKKKPSALNEKVDNVLSSR
jgi:hypothetical protein